MSVECCTTDRWNVWYDTLLVPLLLASSLLLFSIRAVYDMIGRWKNDNTRALLWRLLLGVIPRDSPPSQWARDMSGKRQEYRDLKADHRVDIAKVRRDETRCRNPVLPLCSWVQALPSKVFILWSPACKRYDSMIAHVLQQCSTRP